MLPVFGLVFLTVGIALWMLILRYRAVLQDGVNPAYFKLNRGAKLPDYLIRVTRHFENLSETPILFYLATLFILTLNLNDMVYIVLAWAYFLSRLVHAYIHTTVNKLRYRKNSFIVSSVILVTLWCKLAVDVMIV